MRINKCKIIIIYYINEKLCSLILYIAIFFIFGNIFPTFILSYLGTAVIYFFLIIILLSIIELSVTFNRVRLQTVKRLKILSRSLKSIAIFIPNLILIYSDTIIVIIIIFLFLHPRLHRGVAVISPRSLHNNAALKNMFVAFSQVFVLVVAYF